MVTPNRLPRCAGAVRRTLATLLDMACFGLLTAALAIPLWRSLDPLLPPAPTYDQVVAAVTDREWLLHAAGILGIWIAAWYAYFVVGWGLVGATPGKAILGLRVVDHRRRFPVGAGRALLRLAAYSVSAVTLGLGHLLVLLRRDRRALHDILAGTRVVNRRDAIEMARGGVGDKGVAPGGSGRGDHTPGDPE